ncbi:hypothetical protein BABINDRAFT_44396 [Babjeviella inositovora NRRL Y-12698]|uniref:Mannosyl-oligosaccharide glucosidase n=1 Tax=Babjeviella inositovora NRRL Y-12698 TaxID=984486 RepID=A0A1E3QZJ6_9ASCO|nr:uncharacterized protein BABINDRAFT_44396 [Babjeviella inositovora NRRL Y-12698]ODQ83045.1 hypothetical protein BABINDRAFT_44396 [Babjeviella inositovora NRRL Y-12698]
MTILNTEESQRLEQSRTKEKHWKRWGPYVGERQWATVREDYSYNGDAWSDFPFEHSRLRAYRWGEDGLAGVSDNHQLICFTLGLWNENDNILKERLFGVTGPQGNHGEDVKELYYYLDNTPTHSYMKYLYKYPHKKFPYEAIVAENGRRSRKELEYEIMDTGVFDDNEYFDVVFEMAKDDKDPDELYFRVTAYNRGAAPAPLHVLPHITFRNTWAWGREDPEKQPIPQLLKENTDVTSVKVDHWKLGGRRMVFAPAPPVADNLPDVEPKLLFTDNETNTQRLYGQANKHPFVKDAFHDYVVDEMAGAVNPDNIGTKAAAWFAFDQNGGVPAGDYVTIRYKLSKMNGEPQEIDEEQFDQVFALREHEADNFYWNISPMPITEDLRMVQRQAFAGLLWTKQFYNYIQDQWVNGDPSTPKPPKNRAGGRNREWKHLYIDDVLSMPDKWEYPFFAAWDTAFHCIPLAMIDPEFAKKQLDLLTREWYMHPNGQIPAYEWNFGDVNPPVHAWAAFRIFKIERKMYGREDRDFLERVFQKLLLNFTWWVNQKDSEGNSVFEGGFLGLDNIGIFNRSEPLPTGGKLEQADATGWMAFFSLQMLNIALELSKERSVYEDIASKFFEHFLLIADAMTFKYDELSDSVDTGVIAPTGRSLWNEEDQFYYDAISWGQGSASTQLPVRSLVGLIPLYACLTLEPSMLEKLPSFKKRVEWFIANRSEVAARNIASMENRGVGERLLLALVDKDRLVAILEKMLDEDEFLSPYGIRSLSKYHDKHPYAYYNNGNTYDISYLPGESDSGLFGGNSNWRGPIWFPVNFLIVESLQRFFLYYGSDLKVECPKGSGEYLNLAQVAQEIEQRLIHLFIPNAEGKRACNGDDVTASVDPFFKDYIPFYEYFHGDTGRGLGASHQCGWTALVAKWIHDVGTSCRAPDTPRPPTSAKSIANFQEMNRDHLMQYVPKSGPFPGSLTRRKSGKSLINLTAQVLEMSEEEKGIYGNESQPSTPGKHLHTRLQADSQHNQQFDYFGHPLSRESTNVSFDSEVDGDDGGLLEMIRRNLQLHASRDAVVSSDELETHN